MSTSQQQSLHFTSEFYEKHKIDPHRHSVDFPGRYYDEEVIMILRRVSFPFAITSTLVVVLIILPVILLYIFQNVLQVSLFINDANKIIGIMTGTVYYLVLGLITLVNWIDYYFDVSIITDRRILDIDQTGLFERHSSEVNLEDVQECTVRKKNLFQNLLDYGDISIQSSATKQNIEIFNTYKPYYVASIIADLREQIDRKEKYPIRNEQQQNDNYIPFEVIDTMINTVNDRQTGKRVPLGKGGIQLKSSLLNSLPRVSFFD